MSHIPDSGLMGLRPLDFAPEALTRYDEPPRPEEGDWVRSSALTYYVWGVIAITFLLTFAWVIA